MSKLETVAENWGITSAEDLETLLSNVSDICALMVFSAGNLEKILKATSPEEKISVCDKITEEFDRTSYTDSITLGCTLAATAVFTSSDTSTFQKKYIISRFKTLMENDSDTENSS